MNWGHFEKHTHIFDSFFSLTWPRCMLFNYIMAASYLGRSYAKANVLFWLRCMAWGVLVPVPGTEPAPSAVKAQSPNHWTRREFQELLKLEGDFLEDFGLETSAPWKNECLCAATRQSNNVEGGRAPWL